MSRAGMAARPTPAAVASCRSLFPRTAARWPRSGKLETGVRLWDVATASQRGYLRGHSGALARFAFSPDGTRLITASADRTARLWDLESGESRALAGHPDAVFEVAFSPDGRLAAAVSRDGTIRVWTDDLPYDPAGIRAFLESATPDEIDPQRR
jgi:WD40 repeat protein